LSEAGFIANARMYSVTPEVEAAWRDLLGRILAEAGLDYRYESYPAPKPLEQLWSRADLGCVFMCGYPIALELSPVTPIAAPVPSLDWAGGRPLYRSDLIVRADAPFDRLEDTFGHRLGWTVEHSHSGFNALRHHLLAYRSADRPALYGEVTGHLITARGILDEVLAGEIDVGPLDGYWHALIRTHRPELLAGVRVVASTALAPIPAFVAAPTVPDEAVRAMKAAFAAAHRRPWFAPFAETLLLSRFEPVAPGDFAVTLERDRAALDAGYPLPA
jgi:ABC-type phosphate/phosphonate transport system substrate-binding protein